MADHKQSIVRCELEEGKGKREEEGKESTSDLMKTLEEISGRHTGTFEYLLHQSPKGVHGEEEQQRQSKRQSQTPARVETKPITTTTGQRILLQRNERRSSDGGSRTSRSRRSESARSSASARSSGESSGGRSTGYDQYGERRSTQFGDVFDLHMDVIRRSPRSRSGSRNSRNSRNSRSGGGSGSQSSRWCSGTSLEQIGGATGLFDTTRPHFFQQSSSSKSCDDDPPSSRASSLSSATFAEDNGSGGGGDGGGGSSNDAAGTTISDSKQQGVEQHSRQRGQQHRQSRNGTRGGGGYLFVMGCEEISSNKNLQNNKGGIVLGTGTGNGRGRQCVVNDCSGRSSGSNNDDDGNDHGRGGSDLSTMVCAGWSHRHV